MFSCSAELHIVHGRVIQRDFGESHALAVVQFDMPNWLQRFYKSLVTFIVAFAALFKQFKAECVSVCPKSFSVCLIMARGCSSVQTTSPLNTLLIPAVDEQQGTDCVSHYTEYVCERETVGGSQEFQTRFSL